MTTLTYDQVLAFLQENSMAVIHDGDESTKQTSEVLEPLTVIEKIEKSKGQGNLALDDDKLRIIASINALKDYDVNLAAQMAVAFALENGFAQFKQVDSATKLVFEVDGDGTNYLSILFSDRTIQSMSNKGLTNLKVGPTSTVLDDNWNSAWNTTCRRIEQRLENVSAVEITNERIAILKTRSDLFKVNISVDDLVQDGDTLRTKTVWSLAKFARNKGLDPSERYYDQIVSYCAQNKSRNLLSKVQGVFTWITMWVDKKKEYIDESKELDAERKSLALNKLQTFKVDVYSLMKLAFDFSSRSGSNRSGAKVKQIIMDGLNHTFNTYSSESPHVFSVLNSQVATNIYFGPNAKVENDVSSVELQVVVYHNEDGQDLEIVEQTRLIPCVSYVNTASYTANEVTSELRMQGTRCTLLIALDTLLNADDGGSYTVGQSINDVVTGVGCDSSKCWLRVIGRNNRGEEIFSRTSTLHEANLDDSGYIGENVNPLTVYPTFGNYKFQVLHYICLDENGTRGQSRIGLRTPGTKGLIGAWRARAIKTVVCSSITRIPYSPGSQAIMTVGRQLKASGTDSLRNFRSYIPYNIFTNSLPVLNTLAYLVISSFRSEGDDYTSNVRNVSLSTRNGLHNVKNMYKLVKSVGEALLVCAELLTNADSFIDRMSSEDCSLGGLKELGYLARRPSNLNGNTTAERKTLANFIIATVNTGFILAWWLRMLESGEHLVLPLDGHSVLPPVTTVEVLDYILWTSYSACGLFSTRLGTGNNTKNLLVILREFFKEKANYSAEHIHRDYLSGDGARDIYRRMFFSMFTRMQL